MATLIEGLVQAGVSVDLLLPPEVRTEELGIGAEVGNLPLDRGQMCGGKPLRASTVTR
jgi:hypothetical protein